MEGDACTLAMDERIVSTPVTCSSVEELISVVPCTETCEIFSLWRLLERYRVPVFLFINKMDQPGTDADRLLAGVQKELDGRCVSFACTDGERTDAFYENVAVCDETLLERVLRTPLSSA